MKRAILCFGIVWLTASCSTPEATELPDEERQMIYVIQETTPSASPVSATEPELSIDYSALEYRGVRGGRATFTVEGDPSDVAALLLDFSQANGRRAWAKTHEPLPDRDGSKLARWNFEGKAGINPSVVLEFRTRTDGGDQVVRYRLAEPAFGLAAFFGDYRVRSAPNEPRRSILTERVFIDSGTWLANATAEDIEEGLREDARLITAWCAESFGTGR